MNGLTHEDRREESVVSRSFYRIRGVPIGRRRFVIHKWGAGLFGPGLLRRGSYRLSDPEKTVLDLAYLDYGTEKKERGTTRAWREHLGSVDARRLRGYLGHYPPGVKGMVEERL